MKLSSGLGLAAVGLCCAGVATMLGSFGCSSSGSGSSGGSSSGGGSGGDTCSSPGVQCTVQPSPPSGGAGSGKQHNYAVHTLYLGDTDRTGVTNPDAWKSYGYNLDNLVTTKTSTDVCTLAAGAAKTTQVDGNGGIDNSFGENILPIVITTAGSDAAARINTSIQSGSFTVMTVINGFDDTGAKTNATGLTGVLLAGGSYAAAHDGGAPSWDTNTHWPIVPTLIAGCTPAAGCGGTNPDPIGAATIKFPSAYQANGTFVNGSPASLSLNLSIGGQSLTVNISSALITFDPKQPGAVTNGTIAGTIVASDLVNQLQGVAGSISTSLCSGSAFNSIAQQILQAADIIIDSSGNVSNTAGTACNGISIGIGFEGTEIAIPVAADIEGPQTPKPSPCDGGTD